MKILVTGGGGFLGRGIVKRLVKKGWTVRSFSRSADYPELSAWGVELHAGDLGDFEAVRRAVRGMDLVFHVAAQAGVWGAYAQYYRANVTGTRNVIEACRQEGITRLVYTSSPSVVFAGKDENGVDESVPYPGRYLCAYPATKALAEQMILKANSNALATVALRPHLIWGPGDPHLVPRILSRARSGKLRLVGDGTNLVDSTYIDNAVEAHLAAASRLAPGAPCAGKAYFITNGEPISMAELLNRILAAAGLPPVTRTISPAIAYGVGALLETVYRLAGIKKEPLMTRFVARQLAAAHWFNISAAKRDLGYTPAITLDEGMKRLAAWLKASC